MSDVSFVEVGKEDEQPDTIQTPLKRFRSAKTELYGIFDQMSTTVNQLHRTLEDASGFLSTDVWWVDHKVGSDPVVQEGDITEARKLVTLTQQRTKNILETVKRDTMKAVFFGRTSNGKSTLINAMLGTKILPSGIGHTTNCFCRIRGVDESEPYIVNDTDGSKLDLSELKKLAHALYSEQSENIKTAEIMWPRMQCKLLQDYVEILDSPGLDISEENDKWIDLHCKDADILVLVANSESALNMTERRFIGHVHKKLVDPSVFICFNRWDCMDDADDATQKEGVKKQHLESAVKLLLQELESDPLNKNRPTNADANNRIFLLSAKEALARRTAPNPNPNPNHASEQVAQRYAEFERFETAFEKCMSFTAMNHRFESHVHTGVEMAHRVGMMLGDLCQRVEGFQASMSGSVVCAEEDLENLNTSTKVFEVELPKHVQRLKDEQMQETLEVLLRTSGRKAIAESVARFKDQMLFDTDQLHLYSSAIGRHLLKDLKMNLVEMCDDAMESHYIDVQQLIRESNMAMILKLSTARVDYPGSALINLNNITDNFRPNVTFRFSFGRFETHIVEIQSLAKVYTAKVLQQYLMAGGADLSTSNTTDTNSTMPQKLSHEEAWPVQFFQSNAGVVAVVSGLGYFTHLRKVLEVGAVALAMCWGYQYMTHTKVQQIETFKKQLIEHASQHLSDLAPQISYYNTQEWAKHTSELIESALVAARTEEVALKQTVEENEQRLSDLNKLNAVTCRMRHRADEHVTRLQRFEERYLGDLSYTNPPLYTPDV